ncbi:ABC1 kinase family protein [Actinokineospora guangxiensis]|uniref:ABC1 kinase family protein n=1 Tax=Actinokineospora guangxiensis TaxID=1490288 RepID=A0ABW0EKX3_9PSEU
MYLLIYWPLVVAARRVLGVRVGTLRALIGAAVGWSVATGMVFVLPFSELEDTPGAFIGLLVTVAGTAFLATLAFLFVAEMASPSGTGLGVIGRVRAIRRSFSRTRRYSRISRIIVKHGLAPYLYGRRDRRAGVHREAALARSLRRAMEEAGVTFVKLGQVLSTRPDLLPPAFIAELSTLQTQVAAVSAADIERVLTDELGVAPAEAFAEFDPEPIAAASVAQVHRARLKDGTEVVVKVQRPGIREVVERDLDILHRVVAAMDTRAAWARSLGVVDLASGFAAALVEELDFRVEARNIAAVRAATPDHTVGLPVVHEELSTDRVLVMSRMVGVPLADAAALAPEAKADLARSLLECVLRQITQHGVFHADPHPGNVLLLDGPSLGLLDFGSVGRLDAGLRGGIQALLVALDRGDAAGLRDGLLQIVDRPEQIDEARLERALGALAAKHFGHDQAPDAQMFTEVFRVVTEFRLAVPPPVAAVFRSLATLEGTLALLAPGFNLVVAARRFAAAQIGEQLKPDTLRQSLTHEAMAMLPVLRRLPRRLDRIGGAIEEGRLSVGVRLFADERDRDVVTGLLHEVLLAFLGLGAGLIAAILIASDSGPVVLPQLTLNQLIGYNLLIVSAMVGLRLLYTVFRAQSRRR